MESLTDNPVRISDLYQMKSAGQAIACLTAYDASFARAIDKAMVDVILVGDSLGMVLQGYDSTTHVTVDDMVYHSRCVRRAVQRAYLVADMPFASYSSEEQCLANAQRLLQEGGVQMVKLEVDEASLSCIKALHDQGIPVCAHIGLLPQQVSHAGKYKTQAPDSEQQQDLLQHAEHCLQQGADLLLAECIHPQTASAIAASSEVPLIGIGSGADCDGQILVMHDVIGISKKQPKFAHNFLQGTHSIEDAFTAYTNAVKQREFPAAGRTS